MPWREQFTLDNMRMNTSLY